MRQNDTVIVGDRRISTIGNIVVRVSPAAEDGQGMCTKCLKDLDCLRRMLAAAKAMEADPCQ